MYACMHGWIDEWMDGSMDGHFLHSGHVDVDNYARNLPKTNAIHLCRLHLYLARSIYIFILLRLFVNGNMKIAGKITTSKQA